MQRRTFRRRAGVYVVVLGSAMMTSLIGLSALLLARTERQALAGSADMLDARLYAQSAIEMGQHRIRADKNWRTTFSNGTWEANKPIGRGTYTLTGADPLDGDLANSLSDSLTLTGIGVAGKARHKLQVTLVPVMGACEALGVSAHAGTTLTFNSANVTSTQKVSANGTATANTSMISCSIETVGACSGGTYLGSRTTGVAARSMPPSTAFDYYIANGGSISYASLPSVQGKKTLERVALSPISNPYGSTDSEGVYVVDCAGGALRIRNLRIYGTLVVLNASAFSVESSVALEPAVANYPSLLVRGNLDLMYTATVLSELTQTANFNPAGAPYAGQTDTDNLDTYPSKITGLVYASGAITTSNSVAIAGVLVAGQSITASGTLTLTYVDTIKQNPPPGFGAATTAMQLSAGTWKRVVD